jgi:prepilin-type N-terminal cleavage/methylation domain-containing protein
LRNKAFTLLEVLVTVAILAFGILALTKLQILGVRGTSFNKGATSATVRAEQVIEEYRAVPFGTDPPACGSVSNGMTVTCQSTILGTTPYRHSNVRVSVSWDIPRKEIGLETCIVEK